MAGFFPTVEREEIHKKLMTRFEEYGFTKWFIPQQVLEQTPEGERTVPILVSNSGDLKDKRSVIVLILTENDEGDLGVFDYSATRGGDAVDKGSALSLVEYLRGFGDDAPGLIILNPNQIYWSQHDTNSEGLPPPRNVNFTTLKEMHPDGVATYSDKSKLHKSPYAIKGSTSFSHHVRTAIQSLLVHEIVPKGTKLSLIIHGSAESFMNDGLPWVMKSEKFHERIDKVALVDCGSEGLLFATSPEILRNFLRRKSRIFQRSSKQVAGTLMDENEDELSEDKAAAMQDADGGNVRIPRVSYGDPPANEQGMFASCIWVLKWLIPFSSNLGRV